MKLIILRGCPGSGKSFLAKGFDNALICSADNFFMRGDKYVFDGKLLGAAHKYCRELCERGMKEKTPLIILDNTNTQAREAEPYIGLARRYGYLVEVLEPDTPWKFSLEELVKRNTHGVPREAIQRMLDRYEDLSVFKKNLGI